MKADTRWRGGPLLPAPDPSVAGEATFVQPTYTYGAEVGTDQQGGMAGHQDLASLWVARQDQWRQGFEAKIAPNARRYWALYRNYAPAPNYTPGQEWRDQTVIPEPFKILATRVPRLVLGQWGMPEPFTVNGVEMTDVEKEEQIRLLLKLELNNIGKNDPEGETHIKREIDAAWYREVVGHVWWKVWWRRQHRWIKTKIPHYAADGKTVERWEPKERLDTVYDGVEWSWHPVSTIAIDLYGKPRRWLIERLRTSLESLREENARWEEQYDRPLYPNFKDMETEALLGVSQDTMEEPRDTERWPLSDDAASRDPNETPVELWLCYDNEKGTLTKLANRRVVLDHGLMDTPDGYDPFVADPAIPIPGSPYGDSFLNWTWMLHVRQTRLARARMDQISLNLFDQIIVEEGVLPNTTWVFRPGGITVGKRKNPERPMSDSFMLNPKRPPDPTGFQDEVHIQQQAEATSGADSVSMGVEATSKSRDVTAAEVNQRVLQGASRFQLEVLYHDVSCKLPKLKKTYDLLRMNLTTPRIVRITGQAQGVPIDLTQLEPNIDIVVGLSQFEASEAERLQSLQQYTSFIADPNVAAVMNFQPFVLEMFKADKSLKRDAKRFVKTMEEIQREQAMAQAAALTQGAGASPNPSGPTPAPLPAGAEEGPGAPGGSALAGPGGAGLGGPATSSGGFGEEEF